MILLQFVNKVIIMTKISFKDTVKVEKTNLKSYNFEKNKNFDNDDREPEKNVEEELEREIRERRNSIQLDEGNIFHNEEIKDTPKTFIREYLHQERLRNRTLQLKGHKEFKLGEKSKNLHDVSSRKSSSQKGKCYTCYPRRKVIEHIIQNQKGITFHHDMCNRNMIIVTPNDHYSSFMDIPSEKIGVIFKEIDSFCRNWNIEDYNVVYNQGNWQTHKHFHLKIRTYENIVKRMRGDHFRMVALQKIYQNKDN